MTPLAAEGEKAVNGQTAAHRLQGGHQVWLTNQVMDIERERERGRVSETLANTSRDGRETLGFHSRPSSQYAPTSLDHTLLPTPAVNDMGAAYTPESWDEWTTKMKKKHGNGNGHGKSLNIEALRMLPTPTSSDSNGPGKHGDGALDLRTTVGLMPTPRATDGTKGGPNQRGSKGDLMLPSAAIALLPTPTSERPDGRKSDAFREGRTTFYDVVEDERWGEYGPAIARWEQVLGRPAPDPTLPTGRDGKHQLSAAFVEWMMGLPPGHVTGELVPVWCKNLEERKAGKDTRPVGLRGSILRFFPITRNAQLKALGNGVVPQQAAEALRRTLDPHRVFFIA